MTVSDMVYTPIRLDHRAIFHFISGEADIDSIEETDSLRAEAGEQNHETIRKQNLSK